VESAESDTGQNDFLAKKELAASVGGLVIFLREPGANVRVWALSELTGPF
jgi:hypothetical protein